MKLILLLQESKRRLTVDEIAREFGVSRRTVFRDFNVLSELNVPVTWDEQSGYGIMEGYKVPPLMFTAREIATIMVGLNFVRSQVDQTLIEDGRGVELKIKNVLPDDLKQFMNSISEKTIVDPFLHFGHEKKQGGNWFEITSAISQSKKIRFTYKSVSTGRVSDREVDPYLVVFYRDRWNMIGFSHERQAIRNFVLDRMENVKITGQNYEGDGGIDVEGLIFRSDESGDLVRVRVGKSADRAFRANLPTKIFKEERLNSEEIKVSFFFDNLEYINNWLLQFGNHVKILSPESLIQKRRELLNEMLKSS
ncbi:MAG TPA: YafY family protein [Balneolaceae bacterium]|nr:YafY family protein [Balneolaceae bacterium]